jgi:predicted MFS family arabinose efflux permease
LINSLRGTRGVAKELIKTTSASYLRHLPKKKHAANILIGGKDSTKGIGLLVGSMLITYLSFKASFFLLGLITTIMFILSYKHVADFREMQHTSFKGFFNISKRIVILALLRGILYSGRDLWLVIALPIYLKTAAVNNAQIGFILASGLFVFGVIQPLTSVFIKSKWTFGRRYLKRKWTYEMTVFPSMIGVSAIPLLFSILPHHLLITLLCVMGYNIFAGIATTPHNFLHIKFARRNRTAIDISFYKSISLFGKIVALFLSGIIYDQFGITGCLYTASGSLMIGTIMAYYYYGCDGRS